MLVKSLEDMGVAYSELVIWVRTKLDQNDEHFLNLSKIIQLLKHKRCSGLPYIPLLVDQTTI